MSNILVPNPDGLNEDEAASAHPVEVATAFQLMADQVEDCAIFILDPNGCVASWNRGAERIEGYRSPEIMGKHFSVFYPTEAIASGWPELAIAIATRDGRHRDEGWRVRKAG